MQQGIRQVVMIFMVVALIMFSFSFAMAPIYNSLCRATGWNGKIDLTPYTEKNSIIDLSRSITIQFTTTNNANLPWDFYSENKNVNIHPGKMIKTFFFVKNNSKKIMTVQAIPSIAPWQAAKHFHKIECFCFEQQTLKPGESKEMPVVFIVDKDLPTTVPTITLSYTLFSVKEKTI